MLIEHHEYLTLLDEIDYLKKDNALLKEENQILTQQLFKEKQQRLKFQDHYQKNIKLIEELHAKTLLHYSGTTKEIMQKINEYNTDTKSFLQTKFQALENATNTKQKQAELKKTKSKLDVYELTEFVNKIKTIFRQTQNSDLIPHKKQSLGDLAKWVKNLSSMVGFQQKSGLVASMSASNIKKQGNKSSKMKENKEFIN